MTTPIEERISALVDGESGAFEARRLARELTTNESLKKRWARYHLIGDAMRDELPPRIPRGFSAQVMAQIHGEMPGYDSMLNPTRSRWSKPLAGLAIAASVAAVSVLLLQTLTSHSVSQTPLEVATTPASTSLPEQPLPAPKATTVAVVRDSNDEAPMTVQPTPGDFKTLEVNIVDSRMDSYLATHAEFASQPFLLPEVRVVGFDQQKH